LVFCGVIQLLLLIVIITLASTHLFIPLAFENLGPINNEGLIFLPLLGQKLGAIKGDIHETSFLFYLFQHLSLTIQHFNVVAFRGTSASLDLHG